MRRISRGNRLVSIAALIAAGSLSLAACSSSGGTSANSSSDTSSATTSASTSGSATSSGTSTGSGGISCASGSMDAEGSTAQGNAMAAWIKAYQQACTGATITYNPTGSGDGVTNFIAGQHEFVGSDAALQPSKGEYAMAQKRCGSAPMDLPMVTGPIAVAYNLKNVSKLILNGDVLSKIFTGKIKTWDDPAIKALNSGATLPSTAITVFYRSDSSGTTQNFERYLAATAPSVFTKTPDKDASMAFVGQGKAKSTGVAQAVSTTDGAITYDEYSYAVSNSLQTAEINNGGGPVTLSASTASAAAASAKVTPSGPNDLSLTLDYATKTPGAYPIILVTYEIVCTKYKDASKNALLKDFLNYTVGAGQKVLLPLGYAPLPAALVSKVQASIAKIS